MTKIGEFNNQTVNNGLVSKTDRGTKVVRGGSELDKNAFLTILVAELANQDPTKETDSTQYVSQLAQFASMEQMTNLNNTMSKYANQNLVGKGITVTDRDSKGIQYTGVVKAVDYNTNGATVSVIINEDGKNIYKDFDVSHIVSVVEVPDYSLPPLTSMNGNMTFLLASSFIDKNVEISDKDEDDKDITVKGVVKGVLKEDGEIKVKILLESGETKTYSYDKVIKVGDIEDDLNSNDKEDEDNIEET